VTVSALVGAVDFASPLLLHPVITAKPIAKKALVVISLQANFLRS
jgi:hypothetical protein